MRTYLQAATFFVLLVGTVACVERYLPDEIKINYNYLVVDGFLDQGPDTTVFMLTRSSNISDINPPVPEASSFVQIEDNLQIPHVLHNEGKGRYTLYPGEFPVIPGKTYRLRIFTHDHIEYVSSFATYKPSPEIDSITWIESDNGIRFFVISSDPDNKTHFYKWNMKETWEYSSKDFTRYIYDHGTITPRASSTDLYYCWRTLPIGDIKLFSTTALGQDVVSQFPLRSITENSLKLYFGYSLEVQQQALTEDAFTYWSNVEKNSANTGTVFGPIPSKVTGNIRCTTNPSLEAIGYFTISNRSSKRLTIYRQDIVGPDSTYTSDGYENCPEEIIAPEDMTDARMLGKLIVDKRYARDPHDVFYLVGYLVGKETCIDCRFHGGTLTKPDYWQ